jgi:hypothetical protein
VAPDAPRQIDRIVVALFAAHDDHPDGAVAHVLLSSGNTWRLIDSGPRWGCRSASTDIMVGSKCVQAYERFGFNDDTVQINRQRGIEIAFYPSEDLEPEALAVYRMLRADGNNPATALSTATRLVTHTEPVTQPAP